VALGSVNRQLDTLAQAEEEWKRQPASRRSATPAPVGALEERRSVLQRRRATLQSQLEAYRSLRATQLDLAVSEQHLQAVEKALAGAPSARRRSSEQAAAISALDEQRDLRIRQRDAQRTELNSLQEGVSTAARTPLPDDDATTDEVSRDVLEALREGGHTPEPRDDPTPQRPDVVAERQQEEGMPRQEAGTSGPPDPRGPRDESEERRKAKQRAAEKDDAPEKDTLAQLRTRVAQAAKEARREEVERKAAATPAADHHAGAPAPERASGPGSPDIQKTEKPETSERGGTERIPADDSETAPEAERTRDGNAGATKEHRNDDADGRESADPGASRRTASEEAARSHEADDDQIEERNTAPAAEKATPAARHGSATGRAEEPRRSDTEDRSNDQKHSTTERSPDKTHSTKERSSDKRHSTEERSSNEKHSTKEHSSDKKHSIKERSSDKKGSSETRHRSTERSSSDEVHSPEKKRSSRKKSASHDERSADEERSSTKERASERESDEERSSPKKHSSDDKRSGRPDR
jgi:hypothetical protein